MKTVIGIFGLAFGAYVLYINNIDIEIILAIMLISISSSFVDKK